ncbi:hypothetical protein HYT84_00295 [Candidatus Micrarchaeota archaeon]|nr:hypothetical protein [Candidatus Micrarchaeota archaeon]
MKEQLVIFGLITLLVFGCISSQKSNDVVPKSPVDLNEPEKPALVAQEETPEKEEVATEAQFEDIDPDLFEVDEIDYSEFDVDDENLSYD